MIDLQSQLARAAAFYQGREAALQAQLDEARRQAARAEAETRRPQQAAQDAIDAAGRAEADARAKVEREAQEAQEAARRAEEAEEGGKGPLTQSLLYSIHAGKIPHLVIDYGETAPEGGE